MIQEDPIELSKFRHHIGTMYTINGFLTTGYRKESITIPSEGSNWHSEPNYLCILWHLSQEIIINNKIIEESFASMKRTKYDLIPCIHGEY